MKPLRPVPSAQTYKRRGFVLIVVLVLVTLVAFAGFAFVNTMTNEYRGVHANGDLLSTEQALASAELMLCRVLEQADVVPTRAFTGPLSDPPLPAPVDSFEPIDASSRPAPGAENLAGRAGGWEHDPQRVQEQLLRPAQREGSGQSDPLAWRFSIVSPAADDEFTAAETVGVRFGLQNESARLNVAALRSLDDVEPGSSRRALMALPGMTETAADSILDWLDADDQPREFGAEIDEYLNLPNPLRPRSGIPRTLEELLLVPGVTHAQLFGPDVNRNFVIDAHEQPADALRGDFGQDGLSAADEQHGWADFLTLHSAERNVTHLGRPRVDLNQPDAGRLRRELSEFCPADVVDFILAYREFGPAGGAAPASQAAGNSPASLTGVQFPLTSVADLIGARVVPPKRESSGESSHVVFNPLSTSSADLLALLFDRTTADSRAVVPGRINVNLAPRAVLVGIPGMSLETAERIISRRAALDDEALQTPAWLLTEQVVNLDEFRNLLPFVTTAGDVYRAQIVVWRPRGGPYRRAEVLIDATRRPIRRIVRTDLSAFGIGFPLARLSRLMEEENP
jgi:hypothetical protein